MEKPLVSICMPIYNGEEYISLAIKSVLNQTYNNVELILVNDNADDKTEEIISSYDDKRIRYIKNFNNLGMVNNWNKAVSYANGKYIKLLCQDDLLELNCVEKEVEVLEKDKSIELVTSASYVINQEGKKILKRRLFRKSSKVDGKTIIKKSFVRGKNLFGEPTLTMYRSNIFDKIGFYDTDFWYVPDWDFNVRCLCYGDFYYIDEELSSFRISKTSQTSEIIKNNKSVLFCEDRKFLDKHIAHKDFSLSKQEIWMHNINTWFRTQLKSIFVMLTN